MMKILLLLLTLSFTTAPFSVWAEGDNFTAVHLNQMEGTLITRINQVEGHLLARIRYLETLLKSLQAQPVVSRPCVESGVILASYGPCPEDIIPVQGVVGLNAPHEIEVALTGTVGLQALSVTGRIDSAGVGSSTGTAPAYMGALMATFASDRNLSASQNIPFALLGKYQHTGTDSTAYPGAAVVGEVGDGVTAASYGLMSVVGGDTTATTLTAMYGVDWQSSTVASRANFGVDLQGEGTHDSYLAPRYNQAHLRWGGRSLDSNETTVFTANNICLAVVNSAPVDGTSGTRANICGPGSLLIRADNGTLFQNTNTLASPTWTAR